MASARRLQRSPRRAHDLMRASIRAGLTGLDAPLVEEDLVRRYGTSRNAVRRALQMLAREGLVSRSPRHGTSVIRGIVQVPLDVRRPMFMAGLEGCGDVVVRRLESRPVPSTALLGLRLATDAEQVMLVEDLVEWRGEPLSLRVAYLPVEVGAPELVGDFSARGRAFEQRFGVPLGSWETSVEAQPCEAGAARLLHVAEGSPVLVREQLLRALDGTPKELSYTHYRSDRVSLAVAGAVDGAVVPPPP